MEDKATQGTPLVQGIAAEVASTSQPTYSLSAYSLAHQGSNMSFDDVPSVLKAFKVDGAWTQLTAVASRAGFSALPLNDFYSQVLRRRHKAAHGGAANTAVADIASFTAGARACALAFDLMLGSAIERIGAGQTGATRASDVTLVFLDSSGGMKRLIDEPGTTLLTAPRGASIALFLTAARGNNACLVARDTAGLPRAWYPNH